MFDHLRQKSAEESGIPTQAPATPAKPAAKPAPAKPARASTPSPATAYPGDTDETLAAPAKPKKKVVRRKKKAGLLDFFTPFQRFLLAAFLFFSVSTMGCVLLFALQRLKLPF